LEEYNDPLKLFCTVAITESNVPARHCSLHPPPFAVPTVTSPPPNPFKSTADSSMAIADRGVNEEPRDKSPPPPPPPPPPPGAYRGEGAANVVGVDILEIQLCLASWRRGVLDITLPLMCVRSRGASGSWLMEAVKNGVVGFSCGRDMAPQYLWSSRCKS